MLEAIDWSKSEPKGSLYVSTIHFFSLVPLTMIALPNASGSGVHMLWSIVDIKHVGTKMLIAWRALMIAAVAAGGAFLLDGLVARRTPSHLYVLHISVNQAPLPNWCVTKTSILLSLLLSILHSTN